jgi:hypothetical protein
VPNPAFEACSAFTRVTACTLALSPYIVTRYGRCAHRASRGRHGKTGLDSHSVCVGLAAVPYPRERVGAAAPASPLFLRRHLLCQTEMSDQEPNT